MAKTRRQTRRTEQTGKRQDRPWAQLAMAAGVVVLAATLLLVKDRTPAPFELDLPESPAAVVEQGRDDAGVAATAGAESNAVPTVADELPQVQLERLLASGQPTLAFFHSNNCVQCKKMMALIDEVYPEFVDSVALVDVDVYDERNRMLLQKAGVHAIPTQIFFNAAGEGELVVGAIEAGVFRTYMRAAAGAE